jgi:glycosyltransferase involved in cell wall biosynthesis
MPPHPGGLELAVDGLRRALRERGHEVRWLASATPLPAGVDGPLVRVPAWNALEHRLDVPLPLWGVRSHTVLWKECRWADVLHVHDCVYPSSVAAVVMAKRLGKPVVLTQHIASVAYRSALLNQVQGLAYRTIGRTLLHRADRLVAVSPHVPAYFAKLGVERRFDVIPFGFDARFRVADPGERQRWRREWLGGEHGRVALFAGRLVAKKGIEQVLSVQRKLAEEGVLLVVAGDGPLRSALAGTPSVRHLEQVPHERMHELYGLSDVLFLPSRGEGLPLTLQEAMLCGLPAVVSEDPSYVANVSAAPGVWLAEGTEALAAALRAALASPPARETISAWANAAWSRERSVLAYERVFVEALQGT